MLTANNLTKTYRRNVDVVRVLNGVSLTVRDGEFISIVGASGSGKSTLLHLLGTLDSPDSGSISLDGKRFDNLPNRERDAIRNRTFGYVFQFYHLLPELSALDNVLMPAYISNSFFGWMKNRKQWRKRAEELIERVGLSHRKTHKPRELSGGEMQRTAIARALLQQPRVLLADEPTGNLDVEKGKEIITLLHNLNRQDRVTIVMVTHNLEMAATTDRIIRLNGGKIVDDPAPPFRRDSCRPRCEQMSKPFDATLKQMVDDFAPDWIVWLAIYLGLPTGPFEAIDPELSTIQPVADKVFRLPNNAGLIHLELQSSWGGSLPDRMHLYNTLLHDRYGGPVHSIAILLRPDAEADSLTGTLIRHRNNGNEYLRFAYDLVRVWELPADQLLAGGIGIAPLALLTNDAEPRLAELVRGFAQRVRSEVPDEGMQDRLLVGSYILMGLRYDEAVMQMLFDGVQRMEESATYRGLINRGRVEGRVEGLRLSLVMFLEQKFGSIPSTIEQQIQATTDRSLLESAIRQVVNIASVSELQLEKSDTL